MIIRIPHDNWLRVREFLRGGAKTAAIAELMKCGLTMEHAKGYVELLELDR